MAAPIDEEVIVLVKAVPQVGVKYGETVCCAGVTRDYQWRRMYPIRFRRLQDDAKFSRWQLVKYKAVLPKQDTRKESRHVFEDKIIVGGLLKADKRAELIDRVTMPSAKLAAEKGHSLTIVRPRSLKFSIKPMRDSEYEQLCRDYQSAANQTSFLDKELKAFKPPKFDFKVQFEDEGGKHNHDCGDWETIAAFTNFQRKYGEQGAISRLSETYNETYQEKGMVVALGTMAKRQHVWTLPGMIRADVVTQESLF
jgi:hypothetical protein